MSIINALQIIAVLGADNAQKMNEMAFRLGNPVKYLDSVLDTQKGIEQLVKDCQDQYNMFSQYKEKLVKIDYFKTLV